MKQYIDSLDQWQLIMLVILASAVLIQIIYYLAVFVRPARNKPPQKPSVQPPATVIICARNEGENLQKYLPKILEQDYPKDDLEILLVDGMSKDRTRRRF